MVQSGDGMQFDEPGVAISACVAGSGMLLPWRFPIRGGWIRTRRKLVPVLPQWHFLPAPVHVIYPGSRPLSVRVRCFVNWVMELFAENPEIQLTPIALALESGLAQRT
ncbi:hypothetical protein P4123_16550 [Pseudomonas aeruginosa]|nr:hypothetical protein [Pseudomonas aeruginosa]